MFQSPSGSPAGCIRLSCLAGPVPLAAARGPHRRFPFLLEVSQVPQSLRRCFGRMTNCLPIRVPVAHRARVAVARTALHVAVAGVVLAALWLAAAAQPGLVLAPVPVPVPVVLMLPRQAALPQHPPRQQPAPLSLTKVRWQQKRVVRLLFVRAGCVDPWMR